MTQTIDKLKEIEIKTGFFEKSNLNIHKVFVLDFGKIPNDITICNLKCVKAESWVNNFYKQDIELINTSSETNIWGKASKDLTIYKMKIGFIISIDA